MRHRRRNRVTLRGVARFLAPYLIVCAALIAFGLVTSAINHL